MKSRCNNAGATGFKHYGGRGIVVCEAWESFEAFLADMGERPAGTTLDRIDVDGDYCLENCRWATKTEQASNTRRTSWVTYRGERVTLTQLSDQLGVAKEALRGRLRNHWPEKDWDRPVIRPRGPVIIRSRQS